MLSMGLRPFAAVVLLVALAASASSALAAHRPTVVRSTNTIVSQGFGRQILEGTGLTYGTLLPGGVVRLVDLSPRHDAKYTVTAQVPAAGTTAAKTIGLKAVRSGNQLTFKVNRPRLHAKASLAFSVAGSKFRLVLDGDSVLNAAAVTGKVTLDGTGTIAVNGQTPLDWLTQGKVTLNAHTAAAIKPPTTTATTTTTATS